MLIRKNTKAFKTIREIITTCSGRPDCKKLIRLYITKAGHTIAERVSTESIPGDADLFYDMTYDTVRTNLESPDRQLYQSDAIAGIYFFHTSSNKEWDETPFEFDMAIKDLFSKLPELPVVRKKEKIAAYVFPVSKTVTKAKVAIKKESKVIEKRTRTPDYNLKHTILFTQLDQLVLKPSKLSKKDVLDYYHTIADTLLHYLKDRPVSLCVLTNSKTITYTTVEQLAEDVELPDWIQRASSSRTSAGVPLLCNDKDHLLWYVEIGCIEFSCGLSKLKSLSYPDQLVIEIDSSESKSTSVLQTARAGQTILAGLQLPAFIKTDGKSGLHVHVPLDGKSNFETSKALAHLICQLMRLKEPELVAIEGTESNSFGKVILNYLFNDHREYVTAPYSLIAADEAVVASPLLWEELEEAFVIQKFNDSLLSKRLKQVGNPFETLFRKKVNANEILEGMQKNYSFLL